ncbi:MAG: ABC transporter substrate-binding protein, partial [Acidimicrobiia bacterium]|nr:ABC transporter substrate-binding protein [Acidimicrobiia bacterium]
MTTRRRASIGALAICLIAASCGGDDGEGATSATVDADVRQGVESALGASTTAANGQTSAEHPETMEAWEELWAEERAAIVARIEENGWGKSADGAELLGPDGFRVDLAACPAGWSDTEGVTDTEVKIGVTGALSGPQGDYGNILRSGEAVFKYYNEQGVFVDSQGKDRHVTLLMRDDAYDPARTIPLVDELIDAEKVFAMNTQQSAGSLKTYDKLNQRCIPQVFSQTGHPGLGDPVNHPWTTGSQLAYNTEAVLWGAFIEQHLEELGGSAKVAALVTTNDFGAAYDSGFKAFLAQSPNA